MSLYAEYIKERTDDSIIETPSGFATYRYINDGRSVYVIDIYTRPECRKRGDAAALADSVAYEAKSKGCTEMLGTVNPSAKGSTASLKVLLAYGMSLKSASDNLIVFGKDI
jgi:GNAT superfamily N-acetyltransferase